MRKLVRQLLFVVMLFGLMLPMTALGEEQDDIEPIHFDRVSVHDPSIIKVDKDAYYLFGTHISAAKSSDLINWTSLVESEYQTPENNPIYGDLSSNLAESFKWAGEDDADSTGGYAVWAPEIIWNGDYLWEDGTTGAYMIYYSVSSTYIRSAIGIAVSRDIEGPYAYVDTVMYSGFTEEEAYDHNSNINKQWENTNISTLIEDGVIEDPNSDWFTDDGQFNNALYTNAIDANVLYDEDGDLWMTYGSWSGGIYVLPLDKKTGLPIYPGTDGETADGRMIDRYFGTKIAGGFGRSAEGPYAVYDEETGYYYLYVTYGGLASDGGYQMRQFRSEHIQGPYQDAAGNQAVFPDSFDMGAGNFPGNDDHQNIGNKMMGNFLFARDLGETGEGIGTGYMAPGHNSYLIDEDLGKEFIITHTRFPEQGEMHQVRVHQTFKNKDGWPVPMPYHYTGEEMKAVSLGDVTGHYKYINHGKEITGELTSSSWIELHDDQTISGAVSGRWELYDDYRVGLTIDDQTYDGVFIEQYDPTSESYVMTFSAMSNEGVVVWGSRAENRDKQEVLDRIKNELMNTIPEQTASNLLLPVTATQGAQITWHSSDPDVLTVDGTVTRPAFGMGDTEVELTAVITLGGITKEVVFQIKVLAEKEAGLAAHYSFDAGLKDKTGNVEEAVVTGDRIHNTGGEITFEGGVVGKAARFDGQSGLKLADGLINHAAYSVSLWVNPEEITEFTTTFFGTRTENNWVSIVPNAHNVTKVWVHNDNDWYDAEANDVIPPNEWTHLALTVDDGEGTFYINGEVVFSGQDFPHVFTADESQFALGVNYWDAPFKGLIDEVMVYNGQVLSPDEVISLYHLEEEEIAEEETCPEANNCSEEEELPEKDHCPDEETNCSEKQEKTEESNCRENDGNLTGDSCAEAGQVPEDNNCLAEADCPGDEVPRDNKQTENNEISDQNGTTKTDEMDLSSEQADQQGKLPDTFTNQYNLLLWGIILVGAGMTAYFMARKRRAVG
ncbi:LamG-like jellyroll fold domain-containing protein [Gracilibacillus alcaliphilus]|uniref:LamG-like jellyroll fold domain-containing protein n=1 Tax=Gracilibacillus alcaliphilus TaxID=1401441 RepID=UPI00195E632C|nr:LamG-like jellyroll fold domain-containing protein [Gracilibacillus alcaliphilus]MBM7679138.1 arabinan endo-1,5-alpha-L-arabinosidase [Gracilibacillus alcaliphilus]